MKKSFYLIPLFILAACAHDMEVETVNHDNSPPQEIVAYISKPDTGMFISDETVRSIAELFKANNTSTRSTNRDVKEISTINADDGSPLLHIVNYQNNQGFVVISATQNYAPILAQNDVGNLIVDDSNLSGLSLWLAEQQAIIANSRFFPDSIKSKYRNQWSKYNKQKEKLTLESHSRAESDVLQFISSSVNQWASEGYSVYRLSEYKNTPEFSYLPADVQENLLTLPYGYGNPNYGGIENVTFVLRKQIDENEKVNPLLNTTWGQSGGYNQYVPGQIPVGCIPVAMGQIMKYHQHPQYYAWNAMANNYATSTTASFLYGIGTALDIDYEEGKTGSNMIAANNVFRNTYNYQYSQIVGNHNYVTIKSQLDNARPVLMKGIDSSAAVGHAWVCDGYSIGNSNDVLKLMTLEYCPTGYEPQAFVNPYSCTLDSYPYVYLHMNWGWNGYCDGYFYNGNVAVADYDFSSSREMIINIYP